MLKSIKKIKIIWLLLFFCINIPHKNYGIMVSFDVLFPMTWYEKGLNATIFLLHKISSLSSQKKSIQKSLDIILGKCIFAYFCFEKMSHNKQQIIDEDVMYLVSLLQAIENDVAQYECNNEYEDHMMCLENIIVMMKKKLKIPCDVNTKRTASDICFKNANTA